MAKKVAMMLGPGFEDSEFRIPYEHLAAAGHEVTLLGSVAGQNVRGKHGQENALVELAAADGHPRDFDALLIPGGRGPEALRHDAGVVSFVRGFGELGRPIAAICHGPELLVAADLARGRTLTSWPAVRQELENAGAHWVDEQVVHDRNLITSRKPEDLGAFSNELLSALAG